LEILKSGTASLEAVPDFSFYKEINFLYGRLKGGILQEFKEL